jgi:uncharacterized protein
MAQSDQDRRVDYVEFGATDIERTRRFYERVFGWRFEDYGPDYTSFQDGRLTRLEEVEGKIRSEGGKVVRPTYEFPGGRRFHFTDPSGNELAVWTDH